MRFAPAELDAYVADLAELAERYGITLTLSDDESLSIETEPGGGRRFNIVGSLPDGRRPPQATVQIAEKWQAVDDAYERSAYRYELIDHQRGYRRAFHRHDDQWFVSRFGVVVHEHCESPIGETRCPHHFGPPIADAFKGIEALMSAWVADSPDCDDLPCLEPI